MDTERERERERILFIHVSNIFPVSIIRASHSSISKYIGIVDYGNSRCGQTLQHFILLSCTDLLSSARPPCPVDFYVLLDQVEYCQPIE